MCFSANASFIATGLLLPLGIYALKAAWVKDSRYLPLAMTPVAFGIQQGFEGVEWLALESHQAELVRLGALGFLFFSHGFWLVWLGWAMLALESRPWAKKLLLAVILAGFLFGASLYGPFLLSADKFSVIITQHSINYQTQIIYDRFFSRDFSRLIYMLIVLGPLCLIKGRQLKILAGLIAFAWVIAECFLSYAFVSIWCFLAAILSLYIVYVIHSVTPSACRSPASAPL